MACDASFLKHYHTPVIHFGILHFKNEEILYYSAGPISQYSPVLDIKFNFSENFFQSVKIFLVKYFSSNVALFAIKF